MEQYFKRLVENAIDFLAHSIEELRESPKYSVIHFHAAVELFLKARLMAEHWSLVVTNRKEPDWEKFVTGDFQSVTLGEANNKLKKVVRSGLNKQEFEAFVLVTKHRNKIIHFYHEAHSAEENAELLQEIAKQQLNAWYLLHRLLRIRWKDVFEEWSERIDEVDNALRNHHEFLQVVFDHLSEKIKELKKSGTEVRLCPSCNFESQVHEELFHDIYDSECLVCGLSERYVKATCPNCDSAIIFVNEGFGECHKCKSSFEPDAVAELLLDDGEAHIAAMEGDDSWDLGNCSFCDGYHTVARIDDELYFCASCFVDFDHLEQCDWCNEMNTGNMENSYAAGCSHCDGRVGWDS